LATYAYAAFFAGAELPPLALLAVTLPVLHLSYVAYVWLIERRTAVEFSASRMLPELGAGSLTGAGLCCAVVGVLWLLGYYRISAVNPLVAVLPLFAASVYSGYLEEILARGIVFRIIEEGLGTWFALAISALLFGLLHLANPNSTILSALAIALTGGVVLGAGYVLTRRLWLPIGAHFAWNFTLGGVFGLAISGHTGQGLVDAQLTGPELLTGGTFGPEASLLVILFGFPVGVSFLRCALYKNRVKAPLWRARAIMTNSRGSNEAGS
jgi:membrane protease YdiL (CAAX protease family)